MTTPARPVFTQRSLARMIDHTILKPEATKEDVLRIVEEAATHRFASVCVNGMWTGLVAKTLRATNEGLPETDRVLTCTVIGFPLGACHPQAMFHEASVAIECGTHEVDMVIPVGSLLGKNYAQVKVAIGAVMNAIGQYGNATTLKAILETALLSEEDIRTACEICRDNGVDYVKTSTGFHPKGGATIQAVQWLRQYGTGMKVKASGGIRDLDTALKMIEAGADRLGCSASVAIIKALPD